MKRRNQKSKPPKLDMVSTSDSKPDYDHAISGLKSCTPSSPLKSPAKEVTYEGRRKRLTLPFTRGESAAAGSAIPMSTPTTSSSSTSTTSNTTTPIHSPPKQQPKTQEFKIDNTQQSQPTIPTADQILPPLSPKKSQTTLEERFLSLKPKTSSPKKQTPLSIEQQQQQPISCDYLEELEDIFDEKKERKIHIPSTLNITQEPQETQVDGSKEYAPEEKERDDSCVLVEETQSQQQSQTQPSQEHSQTLVTKRRKKKVNDDGDYRPPVQKKKSSPSDLEIETERRFTFRHDLGASATNPLSIEDDNSKLQEEDKDKEEKKTEETQNPTQQSVVLIYQPDGENVGGVTLTRADIELLKPESFINDSVIEFYLLYIEHTLVPPKERKSYHWFTPFFFKKLTSSSGAGSQDALRWTKSIDVFKKKFLVIPVNEKSHWVLVIVCLKNNVFKDVEPLPYILFFDSLGNKKSSGEITKKIRSWLSKEYKKIHPSKDKEDENKYTQFSMPVQILDLPLQNNWTDCGLFLMHYAEKFVLDRPKKISDFKEWFKSEDIANKREQIRELIMNLASNGAVETAATLEEPTVIPIPITEISTSTPTIPVTNKQDDENVDDMIIIEPVKIKTYNDEEDVRIEETPSTKESNENKIIKLK